MEYKGPSIHSGSSVPFGIAMALFKDPLRHWFRSDLYRNVLSSHKSRGTYNVLSLQGGVFLLPDEARSAFLETYARECTAFNFSLVECRTRVFPFLADFDHVGCDAFALGDSLWTLLETHIGAALSEYLECAPASDVVWQIRTEANRHAVWPGCLVDTSTALAVRARAVETLLIDHSHIDWDDIIDPSVLKKNGLRMLGSYKAWKDVTLLERAHPEWARDFYGLRDGVRKKNVHPKTQRPYNVVDTESGTYADPGVLGTTAETLERHSVYRPQGAVPLPLTTAGAIAVALFRVPLGRPPKRKGGQGAPVPERAQQPRRRRAETTTPEALRLEALLISIGGHGPGCVRSEDGLADGRRRWYVQCTSGERTCPHGNTHASNNAFVTLSDGALNYMCFGRECRGSVRIGSASDLAEPEPIRALDDNDILDISNRYVAGLRSLLDRTPNVCIRSPMGSGKTRASKELLMEESEDARVLLLSSRVRFAESVCAALNAAGMDITSYTEVMHKEDLKHVSRLVVQMESLTWLENAPDFDVVLVDESESCLAQFASQATMQGRFADCARVFERLVRNAARVVWMDAFLGERTLGAARALRGRYVLRNYIARHTKRAMHVVDDKAMFTARVVHAVCEERKNVFVASGSKRFSDALHVELLKRGVSCLYYHSDMEKSVADTVKTPNSEWTRVRAVITTPSITIGIDCDSRDHFDDVFVYASASSCCPRDLLQMTMRPRHIRGAVFVHFAKHFAPPGPALSTHPSVLKKEMLEHAARVLQLETGTHWADDSPWLVDVMAANYAEQNAKSTIFRTEFFKLALDSGHTVLPLDDIVTQRVVLDDAEPTTVDYDAIEAMSDMTYANIAAGHASRGERLAFEKSRFMASVHIAKPNAALFVAWITPDGWRRLINCRLEKRGALLRADVLDADRWGMAAFSEGIAAQLKAVLDIRRVICPGIEGRLLTEDDAIPRERILALAQHISEHANELRQAFRTVAIDDFGAANTRSALGACNRIFAAWGFYVLHRNKRRNAIVNGRVTKIDTYGIASSLKDAHLRDITSAVR